MDTDARVKLMVALGVTSAIGIGLRGGEDEHTYAGEGNRRGRRARGRRAATMTAAAARKYLLKQGWRAKDIDNPKPSSALGEPLPERYRAMAIESSLPAYQVSKRSQAKTERAWRALAGGQGSPARRRYIRPEVEEHYIQGVRDPAFVLGLTRPQQLALWWYANTLSGPQAVRIQEIVELHQAGELPTVDRDWVNPSHPGRAARGRRAKAPGKLWKTVAGVRVYKTPDGEYIVAPDLDYPHGWYYTDDPQDAGGTAMIEGRRRGWGKGR